MIQTTLERDEKGRFNLKEILGDSVGKVSDGYHTFDELYEHRITIFIALCKKLEASISEYQQHMMGREAEHPKRPWKSRFHSDGSTWEGWFIMGIGKEKGEQITYHLPESKWEETDFAETLDKAPEFDGHTPEDVLKRIKSL